MKSSLLDVAVVVLNYNGWEDTIACAESLLLLSPSPRFIIIVDNASTNKSKIHISEWMNNKSGSIQFKSADANTALSTSFKPARINLVTADKNLGYAAGNNIGINIAMQHGAKAVWILNNDTLVFPNTLGALWARLNNAPRPGLCGALVRYFDEPNVVQCMGGGRTSRATGLSTLAGQGYSVDQAKAIPTEEVERNINFIYGASVLASRDFISTVGLMDERYFLYCEEQDWAFSANGRFDLSYAQDAEIFHREGRSSTWSRKRRSLIGFYRIARSRILLAAKFHPWFIPTVMFSLIYALARLAARSLVKTKSP